jgi:hypothetical protein
VYGGGFWYGGGFISCLTHGEVTHWKCVRTLVGQGATSSTLSPHDRDGQEYGTDFQALAISGLQFDASGNYLAVSAWARNHTYYPALLYSIDGEHLSLRGIYHDSANQLERRARFFDRGTATGIILHEGWLIVRRTSAQYDLTFSVFRLPQEVTAGTGQHLHSSRLVGLYGAVATGFLPSGLRRLGTVVVDWSMHEDLEDDSESRIGDEGALLVGHLGNEGMIGCSASPNPHALDGQAARIALKRLMKNSSDEATRVTMGVREAPRGWLSAITLDPQGARLITCGTDGTIASWSKGSGERPDLHCVARRQGHAAPISASCHLAVGNVLITADRVGVVRAWGHDELLSEWSVPNASPRTLAAHPTLPRIAVGCKALGGGPQPGMIAVYELTG